MICVRNTISLTNQKVIEEVLPGKSFQRVPVNFTIKKLNVFNIITRVTQISDLKKKQKITDFKLNKNSYIAIYSPAIQLSIIFKKADWINNIE